MGPTCLSRCQVESPDRGVGVQGGEEDTQRVRRDQGLVRVSMTVRMERKKGVLGTGKRRTWVPGGWDWRWVWRR